MALTKQEIINQLNIIGAGFTEYKAYVSNRLNQSMKMSQSEREQFLDPDGSFREEDAYYSTANLALLVLKAQKRSKLKIPGFIALILDEDKKYLAEFIFTQVTFFVKNRTTFERITGNQLSTPNWSFNEDTSRVVIDNDQFGNFAKNAIKASELDKYEFVLDSDKRYFKQNAYGEYIVVGDIDDDIVKAGI